MLKIVRRYGGPLLSCNPQSPAASGLEINEILRVPQATHERDSAGPRQTVSTPLGELAANQRDETLPVHVNCAPAVAR